MVEDGEPAAFFIYNGMMVVWPTPETARTLAIDFHITPAYMTADEHQPILDVEWHEGILLAARWKAFLALQEFDNAMIQKNEYLDFVKRRLDPKAADDEGRIVLSSVPRDRRDLFMDRRQSVDRDALL